MSLKATFFACDVGGGPNKTNALSRIPALFISALAVSIVATRVAEIIST